MRHQAIVWIGAWALLWATACSQREDNASWDAGADLGRQEVAEEAVADLLDEEVGAGECEAPAQRGCPCEVDGECASGICLGLPEGGVCSVACDAGCEANERCGGVSNSGQTFLWVCVPAVGIQCAPCSQDHDCGDASCMAWDLAQACVVGCDQTHSCLEGEDCWESPSGAGYCVPAEGSCACTALTKGQARSCLVQNEFGSCVGVQQCSGAQGWGACEGTAAQAEQCNNEDDDCDGQVDEGDLCPAPLDSCSRAVCSQGVCGSEPVMEMNGLACTPQSVCQFMGQCSDGVCVGQPVDCDDQNPCTEEECVEGSGCQKSIVAAQCDDGDPCTLGDQCIQGKCMPVALDPSCLGACGDGFCGFLENSNSCALDCGWCGDGICGLCEWLLPLSTCPKDCEAACGDGKCQGGESIANCLVDCSGCGDGFCGLKETGSNCILDCPASCGNKVCEPTEGPGVCPYDCAPSCGDDVCEAPENWFSCPEDCTVCGDHVCGTGEMVSCPQDCAAQCGNGLCEGGENPQECAVDCGPCGDAVCGFTETYVSCPWDCAYGCGDADCAAWLQETPTTCPADCADKDMDGDTVPNVVDNCPWLMNVGQEDLDGDGKGDDCDGDKDGDGEANVTDCAPFDGTSHHGAKDYCDGIDSDCDGAFAPPGACDDDYSCTLDLCGGPTGCHHLAQHGVCNDQQPCTYDTCSPGAAPGSGCLYQTVPDGTPCTDTGLVFGGFASPDGRVCMGGTCACYPECGGKQCGADGCGGTCGACPAGLECLEDGTCACIPQCGGRQCGSDGCGGSCGACGNGTECSTEGQCLCPGGTVPCGSACCASGQLCIGNACCQPSCEGKECGSNGCGGSCGACTGGKECVWPGICLCIPQCAGRHCGDDGCGGSCGTCAAGWTCNAGICSCTPNCSGVECGSDGCGGTCGSCAPGSVCTAGQCVTELSSNCSSGYCSITWGFFTMGTPSDETCRNFDLPAHPVAINNSFVAKSTEFTIQEWFSLMPIGPAGALDQPVRYVNWYEAIYACNALSSMEGLPECYVMSNCTGIPGGGCAVGESVCQGDFWCEEVEFKGTSCLGYRLPTEAEWEYAARAGASGATPLGNLTGSCDCSADPKLEAVAWYCANSGGIQSVAQKLPNAWGLYDVLGNVAEWTQDNNGYYGSGVQTDPVGALHGAGGVVRGGNYTSEQRRARFGDRALQPKTMRSAWVGFRPVRTTMATCMPDCTGKVCGPDGCGGTCGPCAAGESCLEGSCIVLNVGTCNSGYCFAPNGGFFMGSTGGEACYETSELPRHVVRISRAMWVMQTEVTQDDWFNLMGTYPSSAGSCGGNCPVESISFAEAAYFANMKSVQEGYEPCYAFSTDCTGMPGYCVGTLTCSNRFTCTEVESKGPSCTGYRIPTEAEWEHFARAGTSGDFFAGNLASCADMPSFFIAIAVGGALTGPAECGTHGANPWGIMDVAGNVAEFVEDDPGTYTASEQKDPFYTGVPRCPGNRGGSFYSLPYECRHAARGLGMCGSAASSQVGFRLIRSVFDYCLPDCFERSCGDDGCGGSCGTCGASLDRPVLKGKEVSHENV